MKVNMKVNMKDKINDVAQFLNEIDPIKIKEWAIKRLMEANPWLIRGDDMTLPIGLFKNGKEIKDDFNPIDNDKIEKYVVHASSLILSLEQLSKNNLDDWKISQLNVPYNIFYFYDVQGSAIAYGYSGRFLKVGDLVKVTFTESSDFQIFEIPLTEEMFFKQKIYIRYGVHSSTKKDALALN